MSTVTEYKYLERDPNSSLKQLSIKGRRIRARTLYGKYVSEEEPRTPDQIAEDYDVPLLAVLEAIAYCESDPPEIREDFEREQRLMETTGMNDPNYDGKPKHLTPQQRARIYDNE
ncbi:MAG TPA: hypothetical protein VMM76_12550 [Pirellulaceae bacterium]|nr:hypothetical protein [Pirellulaceae bacterium]